MLSAVVLAVRRQGPMLVPLRQFLRHQSGSTIAVAADFTIAVPSQCRFVNDVAAAPGAV